MRQLAVLALAALAGALPTLAAAEASTTTTKILQQRTRDGSILLTDRPADGATTERSWQVRAEDPALARQRAIDVKAEANLVSERIQRTLDQQRRADLEAERLRVARVDLDRAALERESSSYGGGAVLFAPTRLGGARHGRFQDGARPGRFDQDGRGRGGFGGRGPGQPRSPGRVKG